MLLYQKYCPLARLIGYRQLSRYNPVLTDSGSVITKILKRNRFYQM